MFSCCEYFCIFSTYCIYICIVLSSMIWNIFKLHIIVHIILHIVLHNLHIIIHIIWPISRMHLHIIDNVLCIISWILSWLGFCCNLSCILHIFHIQHIMYIHENTNHLEGFLLYFRHCWFPGPCQGKAVDVPPPSTVSSVFCPIAIRAWKVHLFHLYHPPFAHWHKWQPEYWEYRNDIQDLSRFMALIYDGGLAIIQPRCNTWKQNYKEYAEYAKYGNK
jgi:hypothetical protein